MIRDKVFKYFYSILFLVTLPLLSPAHSGDTPDNIMDLSLEEGKLMVLQNNLDIAIQQITPLIEIEKITTEKGSFDPLLSGSFKRGDSSTPLSTRSSVAAGGKSSVESEVYSLSTGLSGKSPCTTNCICSFARLSSRPKSMSAETRPRSPS